MYLAPPKEARFPAWPGHAGVRWPAGEEMTRNVPRLGVDERFQPRRRCLNVFGNAPGR